ncbi:O-antigen ligase family protein [Fictibacillus aquaticus]|uniref:O-antigen ligase-related domain-containing protein n=1 Tax=Fictibacillus aquaticus TaxID=2021314 RepID=A0A235FEL0_9BACL|nr:O-antigen ligase family protein [Fictibacillus aquaticus]OYD59761.1 hypothetical protein CGZ90_07735 [Fictibacillus aquaticus]
MKVDLKEFAFIFAAIVLVAVSLAVPNQMLALGITGIFAVYAFLKPKNGLLLLIMYFPVRAFLIEVNPGLKGIGDAIILASFLKVLFMQRKELKNIFRFDFIEWAFLGFCAVGAISALLTDVRPVAIIFQLRAFLVAFLLYYIVKRLDITKEDVYKFLWVTVITGLIICLHGIIEKVSVRTLLLPEAWEQKRLTPTNKDRIYGLIGNPNVLSVFLSIVFLLTLVLRSLTDSIKVRWMLFVSLVLTLGVLELTYSRGTFLALGFAFIVYLVLTRRFAIVKTVAIAGVLATVLIYYPANIAAEAYGKTLMQVPYEKKPGEETPEEPQDEEDQSEAEKRLSETFNQSTLELSKKSGRLFVITKGFNVFKDHPVIGTGFATFGDSATKTFSSPIYEDYGITRNIYSDNQYIQIIAQTGAVGVIIFAAFLLGMLYFIWKKRDVNAFALPLLALLLGTFVWGLFYNIWENKTFTVYFFILLGYMFNYHLKRKPIS